MGQVMFYPITRILRCPSEEDLSERYRMQAEIRNHYRKYIDNECDPYIKRYHASLVTSKMRQTIHIAPCEQINH